MSSDAGGYSVAGALPVVMVVAVSGILALAIAAWLIRDVARNALERSTQADVPQVLAALGGLLDRLRLFLPWQNGRRTSLSSGAPDDQPMTHTESDRDLPAGGSQ
jgi:hypothetical protein